MVIHKSLRDFRPLRYSSRHGHAEGEHVKRGRGTHTCNVGGRNLIKGLTSAASPRVDMSSTCKVGQKLGVPLPLLTCSHSTWPSGLLHRRGRKSRRDLWITLNLFTSPSTIHIEHYNFDNKFMAEPVVTKMMARGSRSVWFKERRKGGLNILVL